MPAPASPHRRPRSIARPAPANGRGLLAGGLLLGGSLLVLLAAEARGEPWFDRLDLNRDGLVTYAEADAAEGAIFAALDRNGDGLLQRHELAPLGEAPVAAVSPVPAPEAGAGWIPSQQAMLPRTPQPAPAYQPYPPVPSPAPTPYGAVQPQPYGVANAPEAEAFYTAALGSGDPLALDADRDGRLSLAEVQHYNVGNFQRHDLDRNGVLTPEEWDLKAQEHFGYRVNPAALQTLTQDTFAEHDLDGDGLVTRYEWDARVQTEFSILDRDRNGLVAPYEITAYN